MPSQDENRKDRYKQSQKVHGSSQPSNAKQVLWFIQNNGRTNAEEDIGVLGRKTGISLKGVAKDSRGLAHEIVML